VRRFLVHAAEETTGGRYYHKSLEEYDKISLVRDRGGSKGRNEAADMDEGDFEQEEDDEEEQEYGEEFIDDADGASGRDRAHHPKSIPNTEADSRKSAEQVKLEEEWGLYRENSPLGTAAQSTKGDNRDDESDTEDEEQDWREQGYGVSQISDHLSGIIGSSLMIC
jgi:DNA ligase-4